MMKKSLLRKKLSQIGVVTAVAGLFGTTAMQAQAVTLQWRDLNPTAGYISLDKLNTVSTPGFYTPTVNLAASGDAHTLDNGDSFSETLTLLTSSSSLGLGGTSFALANDYRFEVTLNGLITNTGGTPITIDSSNVVHQGADSVFNINFTSGTISLFDNVANTHITDLAFNSGGGSNIHLVAGSLISDITLNTLLGGPNCTAASCDPFLLNGSGGSLAGVGLELLTITTGSTRFLNFNGSSFATSTLNVNLQDNGQSTTFVPEPASLALIGIGLLGFGAMRRGKKLS